MVSLLCLFSLSTSTLASCGSAASHAHGAGGYPIIHSLNPSSITPGSTLTLSGFGFSVVPQENIITIGSQTFVGESYDLDETDPNVEELTLTLPSSMIDGTYEVFVLIDGRVSNTITLQILTP